MKITRLEWWPANVTKLANHGITQWEVTELVDLDGWVPYMAAAYPDQVRLVGPTAAGRLITVVVAPTDAEDTWRPVTGWPATSDEQQYHWEETTGERRE